MSTKTKALTHVLTDTNQSAWQLSSIQLSGFASLPILVTSVILIQEINFKSAVLTLIIGNIITFFIRYGIVAMSHEGRKSTLDIARDYVGNFGGYFVGIMLLASTVAWYIAETTLSSRGLYYLFQFSEDTEINRFIQISVTIGTISTFLCMEGMIVLRWLTVISFPIIIASFLGVLLAASDTLSFSGPTIVSIGGLTLVLIMTLGITADLPTFFRHSRSWKDSFRALIIIQVLGFIISIAGLFLGSVFHVENGINPENNLILGNLFLRVSLIILIFFSVISANVANVYSSSVGWEVVVPILAGRKEYLILGLGCTIFFVLIGDIVSMQALLHMTDISFINLCYVLIIGYITYLYKKRPPTLFEQGTYLVAWIVSTLINNIPTLLPKPINHFEPLTGFAVIVLIIGLAQPIKRLLQKR